MRKVILSSIEGSAILIILISSLHPIQTHPPKEYILILDPSGDALETGRSIDNSFERGLTLQCTEKIKTVLQERMLDLKIIISRLPGDVMCELQNASFANRIDADLFINLNFYQTTSNKPTFFLYHFSYGNDFAHYQQGLAFNPYDQAYKINKSTTDRLVQLCKQHLEKEQYAHLFSVSGPYALPIKPLIGIIPPSISFDIGLKDKNSWHSFVEPLTNAISAMLNSIK